MTIKLAVPSDNSDALRSGIYAFLSMREGRTACKDRFVSITVFPIGETSEYSLDFADASEAQAFLSYLPSVLAGGLRIGLSNSAPSEAAASPRRP